MSASRWRLCWRKRRRPQRTRSSAFGIDIVPLPAVVDGTTTARGAKGGESLLFEDAGSNAALTLSGLRGNPELAFTAAAYTRRERFKVQRHAAVPMEPRGLLARMGC